MPDAQPKPTAAEDRTEAILAEHRPDPYGRCMSRVCRERDAMIDSGVAYWTCRHPVVMLAAAGLLASTARGAEAERAYREGRWCGECRYGVVENPPCCTQPAPEARRCERDPACAVGHSVNCCEKNGVDQEHVDDFISARISSGPAVTSEQRAALYRMSGSAFFAGTTYPVTAVAWTSVLDWLATLGDRETEVRDA